MLIGSPWGFAPPPPGSSVPSSFGREAHDVGPGSPVALVTDERLLLHAGPSNHPERPARLAEILKQLEVRAGLDVVWMCQLDGSLKAIVFFPAGTRNF